MVFDATTGDVVAQRSLEFKPLLMAYVLDGAEVAVYGAAEGMTIDVSKPDAPQLLLLDAETLQVDWEHRFADLVSGNWCVDRCDLEFEGREHVNWTPAVVLSRDRDMLYIVHAAEERLTTVDFDARSVLGVEIGLARSWIERLLDRTAGAVEAKNDPEGATKTAVLSPQGTRLYVLSQETTAFRSETGALLRTRREILGLTIIDVDSGLEVASRDGQAGGIRLTLDGAFLLLEDWSSGQDLITEVLDAESLDVIATLIGWFVLLARDLEGASITLASKSVGETTQFAILDPESFEILDSWSVDSGARARLMIPWPPQ